MRRAEHASHAVVAAAALAIAALPAARCYDLDPCKEKPTFTHWKCGPGTEVACWSAVPSAEWSCVALADAASWASTSLQANSNCRAKLTPLGADAPNYDGACAFHVTLLDFAASEFPTRLWQPLPWDKAYAWAAATVKKMTIQEKYSLVRGVGYDPSNWWKLQRGWYVGNTAPVPRLGIPSLNMQDAGAGFHTTLNELVGTVTCWPSMLALAAIWDPDAVQEFAVALGKEFSGKGANGILGPSVDVHRVARNGRNFEYLSGEDPYLGSRLAGAYVAGVQSQGVFAVMKHWVFNSQETNRESESSQVDDRTAWELYYPPFEAAVDAGVSAVMCSYNRIDGEYSCANEKHLRQVLRKQMGFRGFVQSDWWATHSLSMAEGLDQEMPGVGKEVYHTPENLARSPHVVDDAVTRILAVVRRMDLAGSAKCAPPGCEDWLMRNVTSAAHAALARSLATESIVMLKNDEGILPLSNTVKTIAVIGAAAVAGPFNPNGAGQGEGDWSTGDYYSGGGSGHVTAGHVTTPLDGIKRRAKAAGVSVIVSPTNDIDAATAAARKADVALVVAATTSGESKDRANLNLDGGADDLITAVARCKTKTVVLAQIPGAVVMPWRDAVPGILAMFLGGQETGSAWAAVLFGDHAPTGRLPVMLPATEEDTIQPSAGPSIEYSEGLETSYRNTGFRAAFPFGHGITFTTFHYFPLTVAVCARGKPGTKAPAVCVRARIQNTGPATGRTVAQLYLELPVPASYPRAILKGFQKTTVMAPGASTDITFQLFPRDLSYYNASAGAWEEAAVAAIYVGESSADLRQLLPLARRAGDARWSASLGLPRRGDTAHRDVTVKRLKEDLYTMTIRKDSLSRPIVGASAPSLTASQGVLLAITFVSVAATTAASLLYASRRRGCVIPTEDTERLVPRERDWAETVVV